MLVLMCCDKSIPIVFDGKDKDGNYKKVFVCDKCGFIITENKIELHTSNEYPLRKFKKVKP